MRIVLVHCPIIPIRRTPPIGIALLKAFLGRKGHRVLNLDLNQFLFKNSDAGSRSFWTAGHATSPVRKEAVQTFIAANGALIDEGIEKIRSFRPDIVGFSTFVTNEFISVYLAERLKKTMSKVCVVFGGPQATVLREALLEYKSVDAVIPGEGEIPLLSLADALENDASLERAQGCYRRASQDAGYVFSETPSIESLEYLPFPDFSDFVLRDYESPGLLTTYIGRGCSKKCVFCDAGVYYKNGWKGRSGRRVFEEIKHQLLQHSISGDRQFQFSDYLLNADLKVLEEFCDEMIMEKVRGNPLFSRISWFGNATVRADHGYWLLKKMAVSGCRLLQLGVESGSQNVLDSMRKGFRVADAERFLADMKKAGVLAHVLLMVGFPSETENDFQETLSFIRRNCDIIHQIDPSESFTAIMPRTYLSEHAVERFGVAPCWDGLYWQTRDGSNTYPVRLERFERLCELAIKLGIKLGDNYTRFINYRDGLLKEYAAYLQARKGWVMS